jgi:hypothetical protein
MRGTFSRTLLAALLFGGACLTAVPALADDDDPPAADDAPPPPPAHTVKYTVTSDNPVWSYIYYRDIEPAVFSDYSHNPYQFTPRADVDLGPGKPWVLETRLNDPNTWAMVTVQSGEDVSFPPNTTFRCELAIDGVVVKKNSGPKGAVCSVRNWY